VKVEMGTNVVTKEIGIPKKVDALIRELIQEGDYKNYSDFITEACRSHHNTWYPKKWNKEE